MPVKSKTRSARTTPAARTAPEVRARTYTARDRERLHGLQQTIEGIATRLYRDRLLQHGTIVFRVAEGNAPAFALRVTEYGVHIEPGADHADALLEVMGDPRRIDAIVRGRKDARLQFFAGGLRVRGDMHYLSRLGIELGFLKTPIV